MPFPAARIGDPITHDLITPCGVIMPPITGPSPEPVMIEFLPAAYVTCTVLCTGVIAVGLIHPPTPPPPLGPPVPIVLGSMTVLINNMPAARWAPSPDLAACGVFLGNPLLIPMRTVIIGP